MKIFKVQFNRIKCVVSVLNVFALKLDNLRFARVCSWR